MQGIDDDNILETMPMMQDVEVDLILVDLEISNDFIILQSPDIWIADTDASNNESSQLSHRN